MEIFKATCPACEQAFDCDVSLLAPSVPRLRCPWCGKHFARDESPELFTGREGGFLAWERKGAGAPEIVEFPGHQTDSS